MKRRRRLVYAVGFGTLLWLLFGVGRTWLLLRRGDALVALASRFPRRYAVGEGKTSRMLVLGDSTAAGVGASRLEDTLAFLVASRTDGRVEVTNLAVSGARTHHVALEQIEAVPEAPFEFVLISMSANDVTHDVSPSDLEDNVRTILKRFEGTPQVVLSTTPNFRTTPALPYLVNRLFEARAVALTTTIRKVAADYPNVSLAEINRDGTLGPERYAEDGFHPNAAGYRVWADLFIEAEG